MKDKFAVIEEKIRIHLKRKKGLNAYERKQLEINRLARNIVDVIGRLVIYRLDYLRLARAWAPQFASDLTLEFRLEKNEFKLNITVYKIVLPLSVPINVPALAFWENLQTNLGMGLRDAVFADIEACNEFFSPRAQIECLFEKPTTDC